MHFIRFYSSSGDKNYLLEKAKISPFRMIHIFKKILTEDPVFYRVFMSKMRDPGFFDRVLNTIPSLPGQIYSRFSGEDVIYDNNHFEYNLKLVDKLYPHLNARQKLAIASTMKPMIDRIDFAINCREAFRSNVKK